MICNYLVQDPDLYYTIYIIYKKMNGQLVIKNASVELKDIFHITGMDRMIKFE